MPQFPPCQQLPRAVGIVSFLRAVGRFYAARGGLGRSGAPLGCQVGLKSVPAFGWGPRSAGRDLNPSAASIAATPADGRTRGMPSLPSQRRASLSPPGTGNEGCSPPAPLFLIRLLVPSVPQPPQPIQDPPIPGAAPRRDLHPIISPPPPNPDPFSPGPAHRGRAGGAGAGCSPRPAARPTASPALPPPASSSRGRRSPGPPLLWGRAPPRPAPAPARPPPREPQGLRPTGGVRRGSPSLRFAKSYREQPRGPPQPRGWGVGRVPQGWRSAGARCSPRVREPTSRGRGGDTGSGTTGCCGHGDKAAGDFGQEMRRAPPELRHRPGAAWEPGAARRALPVPTCTSAPRRGSGSPGHSSPGVGTASGRDAAPSGAGHSTAGGGSRERGQTLGHLWQVSTGSCRGLHIAASSGARRSRPGKIPQEGAELTSAPAHSAPG